MRFAMGSFALGLIALCALLACGCTTRIETPAMAADSTVVFTGKKQGDVEVSITLASKAKVSKKTGKRLGVARVFDIGQDEKVHAFVDVANPEARGARPLSFHLVWLDPDRDLIFKRRIEYLSADSSASLSSALSIPKGKRVPGEYSFQVYLFRELIAEKGFTLRGEAIEVQKEDSGSGGGI